MSRQEANCLKVSQITINKFMNSNRMMIDLGKYTLINSFLSSTMHGKHLKLVRIRQKYENFVFLVLDCIAEALKFVLNLSDTNLEAYRYSLDGSSSGESMDVEDLDW
jgi:hypothetical protein